MTDRSRIRGLIRFIDNRWLYVALHTVTLAGCGCCWQRPTLRCPASLLVKFGRRWLEIGFPSWRGEA